MKKIYLFLFLILLPICYSQQDISQQNNAQPKIESFVNDYAHLLTNDEIAGIEPILKEVYDSGKAEYAIVIVDSLNGSDIEGYSHNLAEGHLGDKTKNNGLLLLIAVQDRQYRYEVGRGLEPVLPDIIMGRIERNYLQPNFRQGDYATGIKEASLAIKDILFNNTDSEYNVTKESNTNPNIIMIVIVIALIIIIISFLSSLSKKTNKKSRKHEDYFTAAWLLSSMMKGGKGGFGGSGGFSGGGGFGGFGGGSFGGGGASGHW